MLVTPVFSQCQRVQIRDHAPHPQCTKHLLLVSSSILTVQNTDCFWVESCHVSHTGVLTVPKSANTWPRPSSWMYQTLVACVKFHPHCSEHRPFLTSSRSGSCHVSHTGVLTVPKSANSISWPRPSSWILRVSTRHLLHVPLSAYLPKQVQQPSLFQSTDRF